MSDEGAKIETLLRAGRASEALLACDSAISTQPEVAELARLRGRALAALSRVVEAEAAFERAFELSPDDPRTLSNLGRLALERDAAELARSWFERALRVDPESVRALRGAASSCAKLGDFRAAEALLNRALAVDAADNGTVVAFASLYLAAGSFDKALHVVDERLIASPSDALLLRARGAALARLGRGAEAILAFEAALAQKPALTTCRTQYAELLREAGRNLQAQALLAKAPPEASGGIELELAMSAVAAEIGELGSAVACLDAALARQPARHDLGSMRLFLLSHQAEVGAEWLANEHRRWAEGAARSTSLATSLLRSRAPPRAKLRVGYLSCDFKEHVVMRFMTPVLRAHSPERVEPILIATARAHDAHAASLRSQFRFVDVSGRSVADAREIITELELDIVVDLASHSGSHLAILAERLAPVQASYLGYPGTTGLSTVDLHLTDGWSEPAGSERDFSERLVRLPRAAWAYLPDDPLPEIAERDPARPLTFGCFNRMTKWTQPTLDAWAQILRAVDRSRLILKCRPFAEPAMRARVQQRFAREGLAGRVELRPWEPTFPAALAAHNDIDIGLDTFPYQGTTTTCDALLMGVPVVSWQGDTPASRVALSLLSAVGLEELAAPSSTAYVEAAVRLAQRPERGKKLRSELRQRYLASALGDPTELAGVLEQAYAAAVLAARDRGPG